MTHQNKGRIGVIIQNVETEGGAFSYESRLIEILNGQEFLFFEKVIFCPKSLFKSIKIQFPNIAVRTYKKSFFTLLFLGLRQSLPGYKLLKAMGLKHGKLERSLKQNGIDLAYFLSPNPLVLDLVDTTFITTIWDLGHRDIPEFLEISGDRHYEERETYYQRTLPKSYRVIVDSEHTSKRIQSCYGVISDRVIIGGLLVDRPKGHQRSPDIKAPFFLYPAQFWPHKRHILLLNAFKIVSEQNKVVRLVLTGADKGNLAYIKNYAVQLGISDRVDFLGFVSRAELNGLIQSAKCLVFPTQLGPTNLPPIEAALNGTFSIISKFHNDINLDHPLIKKVLEQDPSDWATHMLQALSNEVESAIPLILDHEHFKNRLVEEFKLFLSVREEWE